MMKNAYLVKVVPMSVLLLLMGWASFKNHSRVVPNIPMTMVATSTVEHVVPKSAELTLLPELSRVYLSSRKVKVWVIEDRGQKLQDKPLQVYRYNDKISYVDYPECDSGTFLRVESYPSGEKVVRPINLTKGTWFLKRNGKLTSNLSALGERS